MAINPTGAIYKTLNFDGQSSGTYGVYITGDAVFNAPERDVEMIEIPGRNGAFALDKGRFQNIEVTYPAGIFAETEADFADAISNFRNYLCSRKGYCRLSDDYNPNEYRLGIYKSGLEVDPAFLKAGQFNITFECKPQRWLSSGETAVAVSSGDTVTNPTYFDAGPLLEIEGYGKIAFNGYEIELANDPIGTVNVAGKTSYTDKLIIDLSNVYVMSGDSISVNGAKIHLRYRQSGETVTSATKSSESGDGSATVTKGSNYIDVDFTFNSPLAFSFGTNSYKSISCSITAIISGQTYYKTISVYVRLNGQTIEIDASGNSNYFGPLSLMNASASDTSIVINSTATTYGHPTYIDCDLGEAYADDNGDISSLNSYIDLGSDLPTLAPGSNTVTFDNTITDLKITPRWWKV